MKKKLLLAITMIAIMLLGVGCGRESDKVSYNLSKEADNFNVVRQLTVINCIEGDILFQMTGKMSIEPDMAEKQLEIIVEKENGTYQKHFVGLSDNVTYVVEDLALTKVNKYKYTLNYNPKMWIPLDVATID